MPDSEPASEEHETGLVQKFQGWKRFAVAASSSLGQEGFIWGNKGRSLEKMHKPDKYPELQDLDIAEVKLAVPRYILSLEGFKQVPGKNEYIVLWEKEAQPSKPHFLLFHGRNGHWGDAYSTNKLCKNTFAERNCRIAFLKMLADAGYGFTAVCLRGYGRSEGVPSEAAHISDISAIVNYLLEQNISHSTLHVAGTSLGTWAASEAAIAMARMGKPPGELKLINPFESMISLGTTKINDLTIVRKLGVSLPRKNIEYTLRHPLDTCSRITELALHDGPKPKITLYTSEYDTVVPNIHSDRIADAAEAHGLEVNRRYFPRASHFDIPLEMLINGGGLTVRPAHWNKMEHSQDVAVSLFEAEYCR